MAVKATQANVSPSNQLCRISGLLWLGLLLLPPVGAPLADDRSDAVRIQFLREKGYCKPRGSCKNPKGMEVDHLIPLWAGGADHPSNMQLLSKEAHRAKHAAERKVLAEYKRTGFLDYGQLLDWSKGLLGGELVRSMGDGTVVVRIDTSATEGSEGSRVPILVKVPMAGLKPMERVHSEAAVWKAVRQEVILKQPRVLVAPQKPVSFNVWTGHGNSTRLNSIPTLSDSLVFPTKQASKSLNEKLLSLGVLALSKDRVRQLPKRTRDRLVKAEKRARKQRAGLWGALRELQKREKAEAERLRREKRKAQKGTREKEKRYGPKQRAAKERAKEKEKRKRDHQRAAEWGSLDYDNDYSSGGGSGTSGTGLVHVRGYVRKDGTYVRPHTRSLPRKGSSGSFGGSWGGARRSRSRGIRLR